MRWDEEERRWLWDVDGHKTRRQRRGFCSEFIIFCTTHGYYGFTRWIEDDCPATFYYEYICHVSWFLIGWQCWNIKCRIKFSFKMLDWFGKCSALVLWTHGTTVSVDSWYSRGKYWQNMIELKRAEWNIWKEVEDRHWLPVCKSSSWKTKQSKLPIIFIEKYETDNWLGLDICGSVAVWSLASQRARFLPLLQPGVGWAVWPVWLRWGCFYVDY